MKLAIISDCHFGFNEDALPQAHEAMLIALRMGADAIILPGDIYDIRVPRQEVLHETIRLYSEIRERSLETPREIGVYELKGDKRIRQDVLGIPLLAIWGTHERRSKGLTNVIQIMDAAQLLISFHARRILLEKGGESVALQGLGGVPEEYFGRTLKVAEFHPIKDAYNIFVFHQNLAELMPIEMEETVAMADLPPGFQLYINGHIHWNHDLNIGGRRLLVAGSTVVTQMKKNEEKPKGFYLFDTKALVAEFVKIPSRPFYFRELKFKNGRAAEIEGAIEAEIGAIMGVAHAKPPQIKIKLSGSVQVNEKASLNFEKIAGKHAGNAQIYIDRDFENSDLMEKIFTLRRMRSEGRSARELGWEILKERLKARSLELKNPSELFDALSEGEIDKALEYA